MREKRQHTRTVGIVEQAACSEQSVQLEQCGGSAPRGGPIERRRGDAGDASGGEEADGAGRVAQLLIKGGRRHGVAGGDSRDQGCGIRRGRSHVLPFGGGESRRQQYWTEGIAKGDGLIGIGAIELPRIGEIDSGGEVSFVSGNSAAQRGRERAEVAKGPRAGVIPDERSVRHPAGAARVGGWPAPLNA